MGLQLILGSSGAGKSTWAYKKILEQAAEDLNANFFVIVPEQFTMETQKDFVTMSANKGILNIDISSFVRLAYRVIGETGRESLPVLEDMGKSMVLGKILEENEDKLLYFKGNVHNKGFVDEIKSLLSEIFQYNIDAEGIERIIEESAEKPVLSAKFKDVLTIYQAFSEYLGDHYIVAEEIYDIFYDAILDSSLLRDAVFCFDGFTGFTPNQYKIIERILAVAKQVYVTVTIPEDEDIVKMDPEYRLFHMSKKTIHKLYELAKLHKVAVDEPFYPCAKGETPYRFRESQTLAALEQRLFRYKKGAYTGARDDVHVEGFRSPQDEVSFVAKEIQRLIRKKGWRYRDIAVVTGDMDVYGHLLEREFKSANINFFMDQKRSVIKNPMVSVILHLLEIQTQNYSYESVISYLRTQLTGVSSDEVDVFEEYVRSTGIRGRNRYLEPFSVLLRKMSDEELERINRIRKDFIVPVENFRKKIYGDGRAKKVSIRQISVALYEFLVEIDMHSQLKSIEQMFEENDRPLDAREYKQVYPQVVKVLEELSRVIGAEKVTLKEYQELLGVGIREIRVGLIPASLDQLVVGDMQRTRLNNIKAMFVLGANEGQIPRTFLNGGLISDREREYLREKEIEIAPSSKEQTYIEQYYLYLNLTKAKNKLYILYCHFANDNTEMKASRLVREIDKILGDTTTVEQEEEYLNFNVKEAYSYVLEGVRKYADGQEVDEEWKSLFTWFFNTEMLKEDLESKLTAASTLPITSHISKEAAENLYGNMIMGSVTRLEKYYTCPYAQFLTYGLGLSESADYKVDNLELGNVYHEILETFGNLMKEEDLNWKKLSDDDRERLLNKACTTVLDDFQNGIFKSNHRYEYMANRIKSTAKRTVWAVHRQACAGELVDSFFEMEFRYLLQEKNPKIVLSGKIDRTDYAKVDNTLYYRVVDYKTGKQKLELYKVYYGLQLQLLTYASALKRDKRLAEIGGNPELAGMYYYHISNPKLKGEEVRKITGESIEVTNKSDDNFGIKKRLMEELLLRGLSSSKIAALEVSGGFNTDEKVIKVGINKDGSASKTSEIIDNEVLEVLEEHVNKMIIQGSQEIMEGNIATTPYRIDDATPCEYCAYKAICKFEGEKTGVGYRELEKMKDDDIRRIFNVRSEMDR
ncbi:MAG: exodeoxyribonuclease V subunit gamma [Lachnospiraceae bacterium]|nr:exodeoxyribonuclease V subunit gamma [Lachnospiraceae bacterium]